MSLLAVGIDQAWDRASPDQLRVYGATFVCRYLGEDTTGKNLTKGEADAYIAAGIAIVSNYEYNPGDAIKGHARGQAAARLADAQHRACGGPADKPIYFSVDVQITNADQMSAVRSYFDGITSVIGRDRTGAYGQYSVIKDLFDRQKITYGWQTYAWSAGMWDPRAQLRQVRNGLKLAGHDVDRNEAHAPDFGQWGVTAVAQMDYSPSTARAIAIGATEYGWIEGTSPGWDDELATYNLKAVEARLAAKIDNAAAAAGLAAAAAKNATDAANGAATIADRAVAAATAAAAAAERPQTPVSPAELADALLSHPQWRSVLQAAVQAAVEGARLELHLPPF